MGEPTTIHLYGRPPFFDPKDIGKVCIIGDGEYARIVAVQSSSMAMLRPMSRRERVAYKIARFVHRTIRDIVDGFWHVWFMGEDLDMWAADRIYQFVERHRRG